MIGSLMYLMIGTRPNIAAAVSIISQFASNPTVLYHQAAKRIIRYIRGTINMKLNFSEKLNFGDQKLNFSEKLGDQKLNFGEKLIPNNSSNNHGDEFTILI